MAETKRMTSEQVVGYARGCCSWGAGARGVLERVSPCPRVPEPYGSTREGRRFSMIAVDEPIVVLAPREVRPCGRAHSLPDLMYPSRTCPALSIF